jgi:hypothetical protein
MTDAADRLEAMAARIRANKDDEFAGAICIIPPQSDDPHGSDSETIELLLIDPKRDQANFWSTAKAKLEVAITNFQLQHQRPNLGFR